MQLVCNFKEIDWEISAYVCKTGPFNWHAIASRTWTLFRTLLDNGICQTQFCGIAQDLFEARHHLLFHILNKYCRQSYQNVVSLMFICLAIRISLTQTEHFTISCILLMTMNILSLCKRLISLIVDINCPLPLVPHICVNKMGQHCFR